jgi:hypothetical protein
MEALSSFAVWYAVRCAIEVQNGMVERNAGLPPERRIEFRVGIHLGDVVEESDGDLMGGGVNIAARLESIAEPGGVCISGSASRRTSLISASKASRISRGRCGLIRSRLGSAGPASAPNAFATEKSGPTTTVYCGATFANLGCDPVAGLFR